MLEPIFNAQPLIKEKIDYYKDQSAKAEDIATEHHLSKSAIWKYKDYTYYKGMGWTETSVSKPDPDEKFKDRVSPTFRKLLDIVNTCKACGDLDILKEYLTDMEAAGVKIIIDDSNVNNIDQESFQKGIKVMCDIQHDICETADVIADIGPQAEKTGLCKANRFKGLAEDYYKLNSPRSEEKKIRITERLHSEVARNLLNNRGIDIVTGEKSAEAFGIDTETGEVFRRGN